jgi:hypothetical protein
VSVLLPDPSASAEFVVSSCRASEAAMKIDSSGVFGSRRAIREGRNPVSSLAIF